MLFIPVTLAATALQVARNAAQRGLLGDAGPWGATLVRFAFGLPFSLVFLTVAWAAHPDVGPALTPKFWRWAALAGAAQIGATAALLTAMGRAGFAVGALFQQSSLPFAAVFGALFLRETPSALAWLGISVTAVALIVLGWPAKGEGRASLRGVAAGLASGACYAVALNGYRAAGLEVAPQAPVLAAVLTMVITQAMQTTALGGWLAFRRPASLRAVAASWKASLAAGLFGSAASGLWLTALVLAPAAPVRAVGVVEAPLSALVGGRLFREGLTPRQWLLGAAATAGVLMTVLL